MNAEYQMIDHTIRMDKSNLPEALKNVIDELEQYDRTGNWVMYDGVSECLESFAKQFLLEQFISERQFRLLLRKYRGAVS